MGAEKMDVTYKCKKCGYKSEKSEIPCPKCGGNEREISIVLSDNIEIHEKLVGKAKHNGSKKPFHEVVSGDDFHRKSGKWNKKERVIDRDNDRYKEIINDKETGEEIHRCEEPLSKHTGHGSAKKK